MSYPPQNRPPNDRPAQGYGQPAGYPPQGGQGQGYPPQDAPPQYGEPQGQPYGGSPYGQPGQPQYGNPYAQPQGQSYGQPQGQPQYGNPYGQPGTSVPPYGQYQMPQPGQPGYQYGGYPSGAANLADVGARFLALLVDAVILAFAAGIPYGIGIALLGNENALGGVFLLIALAVAVLYEPLMTSRKGAGNGQTVGRQVAKVRIVDQATGGAIGTGQAWIRFLIRGFISGSIFYLGYLWALWDPQKQTWHDKIAKTLVVKA